MLLKAFFFVLFIEYQQVKISVFSVLIFFSLINLINLINFRYGVSVKIVCN